PAMHGGFETGAIPARIAMGGPRDMAELDFGADFGRIEIEVETRLEHLGALLPVDERIEFDLPLTLRQGNHLNDARGAVVALNADGRAIWAGFGDRDACHGVDRPELFLEIGFDVPGLIIHGFVFEGDESVCDLAGAEHFPAG